MAHFRWKSRRNFLPGCFYTHDGATWVFRDEDEYKNTGATWVFRDEDEYKNTLKFGRIRIGSNCFIGARSTILPGVTIGDNSIVGACSLVNKSIPSGEVWGVPVHYIMTTKEYAEKCKKSTPYYDVSEYRTNFKKVVNQICDAVENNLHHKTMR